MKLIAGLQVFLGTLAGFTSVVLAINKWNISDVGPGGIVIPRPSPNYILETSLIVIGSAIFLLALVQLAKKIRFATLHIICGQDIVIIAYVLHNYALNYDAYSYAPWVYRLVFVMMAAALLVVITGIFQLFKGRAPEVKNELAGEMPSG